MMRRPNWTRALQQWSSATDKTGPHPSGGLATGAFQDTLWPICYDVASVFARHKHLTTHYNGTDRQAVTWTKPEG